MGAMIVIGTAIVGYTIVSRMAGEEVNAATSQVIPQESPMSFGEVMAKLPTDAIVEEMVGEGNRLMVRIRTPDARQSILIFDLNTGQRLGVLHLTQ